MTEVKRLEHVELSRKTKPELLDLLKRQETLLANEKFVNRLPDRGEKLRKLKQNIEEAICKFESIHAAAQLVQRLNRPRRISDNDNNDDDDDELRNGDDDVSGNVFKTLASNGPPRKIVSTSPVIPSDERSHSESKPASNTLLDNPVWTRKLEEKQSGGRERKKLNKSVTESPTQTPESRKAKYFVNGVWIETGVTPPPSKFAEVKAISYEESYRLQTEQAARQSELQIEMSAMNLITRMNLCRIDGGESSVDATSPSAPCHDINGEEEEEEQTVTTDDES